MELPLDIKELLERLLDDHPLRILKESSFNVINKYNEKSNGENHISSEIDVKVYSAMRYPATFKAFSDSLQYSLSHLDETNITSILDVGSGSAAASIACLYQLNHLNKIDLIEEEDVMINIGEYLLSKVDTKCIDIKYHKMDIIKDDISSFKRDLVISSYVLNELVHTNIIKVIDKMWESTNKVMLVVEPGTPKGYEIIKLIRDHLVSKGGYILAPCPHMDKCPLPSNDWCHFSTRVARSKLHKTLKGGDAPYEDEKYCYIAFSKSPCIRCSNRILRHPQISSGLITLEVCSQYGLQTIKVTKKDKELFKIARKAKVGEGLNIIQEAIIKEDINGR